MNLVIKSVIYRFFRLLLLLLITFIVTGEILEALSISFIDMFFATLYYYYFEKGWDLYLEPYLEKIKIRIKYHSFNSLNKRKKRDGDD